MQHNNAGHIVNTVAQSPRLYNVSLYADLSGSFPLYVTLTPNDYNGIIVHLTYDN